MLPPRLPIAESKETSWIVSICPRSCPADKSSCPYSSRLFAQILFRKRVRGYLFDRASHLAMCSLCLAILPSPQVRLRAQKISSSDPPFVSAVCSRVLSRFPTFFVVRSQRTRMLVYIQSQGPNQEHSVRLAFARVRLFTIDRIKLEQAFDSSYVKVSQYLSVVKRFVLLSLCLCVYIFLPSAANITGYTRLNFVPLRAPLCNNI